MKIMFEYMMKVLVLSPAEQFVLLFVLLWVAVGSCGLCVSKMVPIFGRRKLDDYRSYLKD